MSRTGDNSERSDMGQVLRRIGRGQRLGHAYLLVADDCEHAGRLARAWLQGFVCRHPVSDGEACGECDRCRQFAASSYPHFSLLQPASKSRQILIDDIREFEHRVHLTAGGNAFKSGLIMEAERMTEQAQNALLKTLEEPPSNTILVLVTRHPQDLLPTIRSRCQVVSMLKNRYSYQFAVEQGLFPVLATMRRGAGAAAALSAARGLRRIFVSLEKQAAESVDKDDETERGLSEAIEQDAQLQKRWKEIRDARLAAEYRGLREQVVEAVHCWFLQSQLLAVGVPRDKLPHPELLAAAETQGADSPAPVPGREESEAAVRAAERLRWQLAGNMDETLAIRGFCLELCEKL